MEKQRVQTPDESTPYAIEMLHITKRFPGIIANDDITLQPAPRRNPRAAG